MGLKILIVDDSLIFRKIMCDVVADLFDCKEITQAMDGREALAMITNDEPDLIFMDTEMPTMDGIELIKAIRSAGHTCEIVVASSSLSHTGVDKTVPSLAAGALVYAHKPEWTGHRESTQALRTALIPARETFKAHRRAKPASIPMASRAGEHGERSWASMRVDKQFRIVVVAVSTGGPDALMKLVPAIPASFPLPILVVQHMPANFLSSFARSLDSRSQLKVLEAQAGMVPEAGTLYLSPGGRHLIVDNDKLPLELAFDDGPPECSVKPSADVLFRSVAASSLRRGVLALVLTGMGEDGCRGLRVLKEYGCHAITQDEESCAVYGMPRTVDEAGLSDESVPLDKIADRLLDLTSKQKVGA